MHIKTNRRSLRRYQPNGEINITPFVDVVLVLLIIFMVTSPMLVSGVDVDLPSSEASPISTQDEPLSVTIDKNGVVYLLDTVVLLNELGAKVKAVIGEKKDTRVFIRGDQSSSYGRIMEVFHALRASGLRNVSLVSAVSDESTKSSKKH